MSAPLAKTLSEWRFAEPRLASLPLDSVVENYVRRNVRNSVFSVCHPTPLTQPRKLVAINEDILRDILDMDQQIAEDPDFVDFVSGNKVLEGSIPMSHRYGGHQFGAWAGQLGDGRAHLIGEYVNNKGEKWELQLKGSGKTPYSRFGDGRAVLRSSVREFLCSEAMFYLGIPTSRAASIVVTNDPVPRDMFYDGNMKMEKAAIVLRLAPTWFRFGSFEILSRHAEIDVLRSLTRFVLDEHYSHIVRTLPDSEDDQILSLFAEVTDETAKMIAQWMAVGFTHGVMNTDNLSIKSITIDYGPFGFIDEYDPHFIPNSSDDFGRYDLQNQPGVGYWNLKKLSTALLPVIARAKQHHLDKILETYESSYQKHFATLFRAKLGLITDRGENDMKLLAILLDTMERRSADFTQTFRDLSELSMEELVAGNFDEHEAWGLERIKKDKDFKKFLELYQTRLNEEGELRNDSARMELMQRSNPRYILRNWMAQKAIEMAEADDFSEVRKLLKVLKDPFQKQEVAEEAGYARPPPSWSKTLRVSCSS